MAVPQYVAAPGGGTSIAAALLAFPGALVALLACASWAWIVLDRNGFSYDSSYYNNEQWAFTFVIVSAVAQFAAAGLLGCGAFAMLLRSRRGRATVVLGCGLVILQTVATALLTSPYVDIGHNYNYYSGYNNGLLGATEPLSLAISLLMILFAALTLFLAQASSTTRWLNHRPSAQLVR